MEVTLLKAKLHQATVTEADLHYEGSVSIDEDLIEAAGFFIHERVEIYNITNGNRIATYVIKAPKGSREICINGAAAHLMKKGDKVIICAYATMDENEAATFKPNVVLLDEQNDIKQTQYTETHGRVVTGTIL